MTETQQPPEPEPEPKQIELNETLKKLTLSIESRTADNVLILKNALLNTKHHNSCSGHPEGHGIVERANRTVEQILRAHVVKDKDWPNLVRPAAFCNEYSNMSHNRTYSI